MTLDAGDFDFVRTLLRTRSGTVLEPGKEYLVESRLAPVARQAGYASLGELIAQLRRRTPNDLQHRVVEALVTHETQFFRDTHPFETLKNAIIPQLIDQRAAKRQLNVWCAAVATGQEPYSLAMLLADSFPHLAPWDVQCIATDFCDDVLERARTGFFRQLEVERGLPEPMLAKYFSKHGDQWRIDDQIRRRVDFRNINLIQAWPSLPQMDIILMRNVLIYFDVPTKKTILAKVRRVLKPDGYLLLGAAETTINLDAHYVQVKFGKTVCYQPRS